MPKVVIDYSNTIIYKIYCKNSNINQIYVGHTTNFIKRKYSHKAECNRITNQLKIYSTIRQNGGWDNWDMVEIAKYNCKDKTEARIKEQKHYEELKANLNSCPPFVNKNSYFCKVCNLQCNSPKGYNSHINSILHVNKMEAELIQKIPKKYECKLCDYNTCSSKDFNKHLLTPKHLNKANLNNLEQKNPKNPVFFYCKNCNKCYKARNSLWYHEQKCKSNEANLQIQTPSEPILKDELYEKEIINKDTLIIELLKQNKELLEIVKNGTHNITTHTNSHNKAFNLNFFLNETCKDAMNIMDFVDSIKLQLSDLEGVGELGYVEGISNIIIKNLKGLDVTQRPVHCTDKKRETMYIKDEDKWEKDEEKKKLHKVVRKVTCKNQNLIPKFKEKHPDCNTYHSKFSDQYNKIIIESMGGSGDNDYEKEEKIIKNISKQVFIEK